MPKLAVDYCNDVLNQLLRNGAPTKMQRRALEKIIKVRCGAGVVRKYMDLLVEFGYIKLEGTEVHVDYDARYQYG